MLLIPAIVLLVAIPLELTWARSLQKPTVFQQLAGTWDWDRIPGHCKENPHTIAFTSDQRTMILTFRQPPDLAAGMRPDPDHPLEVRYEVRASDRRYLRLFLVKPLELRRTRDRHPVGWDLVIAGPDRYRWRQTDWDIGQYTRDVVRCKVE